MTKLSQFKRTILIIDYTVRGLCSHPYPNHLHGCPNYGKKPGCPPQCRKIENVLNLKKPVYAIWNKFNLADHVARMKDLHPFWSWRQLVCCLYWQPRARKQLKANLILFKRQHPDLIIVPNPEGAGVNVTATMARIGIHLQWPPKTTTYQVALAGTPK